jgi:hypothetical protein
MGPAINGGTSQAALMHNDINSEIKRFETLNANHPSDAQGRPSRVIMAPRNFVIINYEINSLI